MTEARRLEPRFRPARRIGRATPPTPTPPDPPVAAPEGPPDGVPVSDVTPAVFGAPEATSGDFEGLPLRFVATEEAYGLATGTEAYVDGYPYILEAVRLRVGSCITPPYFGLRIGPTDPLPTTPLAVEQIDGQVVAWVSHLRGTLAAPPYVSKRPQREQRTWTSRRKG
jgi:hypothetical protein